MAGHHLLTRIREDTNVLKAKNDPQAQKIERLKAQLDTADAKNHKMSKVVSGKCTYPFKWLLTHDMLPMGANPWSAQFC